LRVWCRPQGAGHEPCRGLPDRPGQLIGALGKRVAQLAAAAVMKDAVPVGQHGGDRKSEAREKDQGAHNTLKRGSTNASYLAARIKKQRPDIAAAVECKERVGLIPLAAHDDLTLYEREGRSSARWRRLKLICRTSAKVRKRNWFLGWNGGRLSTPLQIVLKLLRKLTDEECRAVKRALEHRNLKPTGDAQARTIG
jgi:hypothetical protein